MSNVTPLKGEMFNHPPVMADNRPSKTLAGPSTERETYASMVQAADNVRKHIPTNHAFLDEMATFLVAYRRRKFDLSEGEQDVIHDVLVKTHYVNLCLAKIQKTHGDLVPSIYDFSAQMDSIHQLMWTLVSGGGNESDLRKNLRYVNTDLDEIIEAYHHPLAEKPLWTRVTTWFAQHLARA